MITGKDLPWVTSPRAVGAVTEWANYEDALDGEHVFVSMFDVWINKERLYNGEITSQATQRAIVEGSEYLWTSRAMSASILWRTEEDWRSVTGSSGCALCLGKPSHRQVKAVVFQNFQTPVKHWQVHCGERKLVGDNGWWIKGGFVLPQEIRESTIVSGEPHEVRDFGSVPSRARDSRDNMRRGFSGHL